MRLLQRQCVKDPNVRVFRRRNGAGLVLVDPRTRDSLVLEPDEADSWVNWSVATKVPALADRLVAARFASQIDQLPGHLPSILADQAVFEVAGKHVRAYQETPDLTVLFNTKSMSANNPLLALNSYGSLVWSGIRAGKAVRAIREDAVRVFGVDEVEPFLLKLRDLGFIRSIGEARLHPWNEERVSKEFFAPEIQFELIQSSIPWYCLWELCRTCNLRCEICYQQDFDHRGPSCDEAAKIAQAMVDSGLLYVGLMGGEPLVRKDLVSVVRILREGGVFAKIITNGTLLSPELARQLADADLNLIEVSFDGILPETHDASRGNGNFARAVQAIHNAWNAGIPRVGVVCTLHSGNLADLEHLPEFLDSHGVHECYLSLFKKTGQQGANARWDPPSASDADRIRELIGHWRVAYPHLTVVLLPGCSCGRTSAVIGADSTLRMCSFQYVARGNVLETSILQVWRSFEQGLPESGPLGFCQVIKPCTV